ncbi:hypothetical protein HPQ64_04730 [Rhizobiales bacterium]|uniref:hypothetical protein n=1 Tax=Hongsoonwoonella zoysiae TaxID=2821844 RepID=UPI001560EB84|nr:hypothetical protein [Hongsoonwoonella zoysiae]NRG16986.1 hypothetical protein [Hongsoonwoonella zoysiae]
MRIDPVIRTNARQEFRRDDAGGGEATGATEKGTVRKNLPASASPVQPVAGDAPVSFQRYRPNSAFLTQLIAVRDDWPDVRLRRKSEPEAAVRLYRETEASPRRMRAGRVLARSA